MKYCQTHVSFRVVSQESELRLEMSQKLGRSPFSLSLSHFLAPCSWHEVKCGQREMGILPCGASPPNVDKDTVSKQGEYPCDMKSM